MKKVSLILAALALVLGISQCKKQEEPVANGQKQHIVLTADNGNDGSKVSANFESANLNLTWDGNEVITVSGGATGTLTFQDGAGSASAKFKGDIEIIDESKPFEFTVGDTPNHEGQPGTEDGCEEWIKNNISLTGTDDYDPQGQYSADMKLPYAVLKLDVSALGTTGAMTIAANGATVASVTDVASSEGKAVFVAVPTDGAEKTYTITCNGKAATKTWTLEKNVFYTKAGAEGAGTGEAIVIDTPKFSVSSTTKVEFAPGNLYWNGSAFKFEANQWSFASTWNASHVSHFKWSDAANAVTSNNTCSGNLFCASNFTVDGDSHADWRTLSNAEWRYLLGKANPSRTDATFLREWKSLDEGAHNGLVILPNGTDASVMNSITSTSDLATYGAVFLPIACYREGTVMYDVGLAGFYWSSTPNGSSNAYYMYFYSGDVNTDDCNRIFGYSVRLVRDI